MARRLLVRIRQLFGADRFRRDLDEEMAFHLESLTRDLIRDGLEPAEARRQARRRFGNVERVHERAREERGLALLDELSRNTRLALRRLRRSPLFSVTFVLTLSLCIGLGTAAFSVADAVLWRPLPYPSPERLAYVATYDPARGRSSRASAVDGAAWERIRDEGAPLERAVYSDQVRGVGLSADAASDFVQQQRVGAGYFATLGIVPLIGREFTAAEDVPEGPAVAILGYDLWMRAFGGESRILGETIHLKGEAHTVVGVMPDVELAGLEPDVWTPLRPSTVGEGGGTNYAILVRTPEGMTLEEGDARVASIAVPWRGEGASEPRFGLVPLDERLSAGVRLPMLIVLAAFGVMMLVGCANLAGLQIARALAGERETATRHALGGGKGALVRQATAENLVLGLVGAIGGLAVAWLAVDGFEELLRSHLGIWQDVRIDGHATLAAMGLTVLATALFSLAPILHAGRDSAHRTLVTGSRTVGGRSHTVRKALLVAQVAMVTALLVGAGLLARTYRYLDGLNPGFDPHDVLTIRMSLDDARYADAATVARLFDQSLDAIRSMPGVTSAAVALSLPYEQPLNDGFRLAGSEEFLPTNMVYVTPAFFATLGIPLLRGRVIDERDRAGAPTVLAANQAFVDTYLRSRADIGTALHIFGLAQDATVVGVVGNVQQPSGWGGSDLPVSENPTLYVPAAQLGDSYVSLIHGWFSPSFVVRATSDIALPVRDALRTVASDLAVTRVAPLQEIVDDAFAWERLQATFLLAVGAFTLLLAVVGLYGLVAHEVQERRGELGLRLSLGASPRRAVWATSARGIGLTIAGLAVGGAVGVTLARTLLSELLHGVSPYDLATLSVVLGGLLIVSTAASLVPAARVARIDPAEVLRAG